MNKISILVCDDDKAIVDAISIYLEQEGFNIVKAYNGKEAIEKIKENNIKLILMDIMMPQMDGLNATVEIRKNNNMPIIFLSAKSEDTDKIVGLNFGADDYITKPFNPLELVARVKSQLRRYTKLGSIEISDNVLTSGDLVLNTENKTVFANGKEVNLTAKEYGILRLLMSRMGKIYSIPEIYERVWGEEAFSAENIVAVHIRRIREKIEIDSKKPKYLKVVWGIGYKIEKYDI